MQLKKRVVPVSISMPPILARRVRVLAAKADKSRSKFVCEVLEKVLAEHISAADCQPLAEISTHQGVSERSGLN